MRLILAIAALMGLTGPALAQQGMAEPWQLNLQDPASPLAVSVNSFHDLLLVIITLITLFVLALLIWVMVRYNSKANPTPSRFSHNTLVEVLWTVVPVLILIVIAVPSFRLLYASDKVDDAEMTLKVTGSQWYWSYEYPDHGGFYFDSVLLQEGDEGYDPNLRLLKTDNPVVIPVKTRIRVLVTAADVGHSWALPANGTKIDGWPGRVNSIPLYIEEPGTYFGQCSELCGTNHGFMPIMVKAVPKPEFEAWVKEAQAQFGAADGDVKVAAAPAN